MFVHFWELSQRWDSLLYIFDYRQRERERVVAAEGGQYYECWLQLWYDELRDTGLPASRTQTHHSVLSRLQDARTIYTVEQITDDACRLSGYSVDCVTSVTTDNVITNNIVIKQEPTV